MRAVVTLPPGWGIAWLCAADQHDSRGPRTTRSYDHTGRQLVWAPARATGDVATACDIEACSAAMTPMAARFGLPVREFARRWVVTEVLAKLGDVPILAWLQRHGLADPDAPLPAETSLFVTADPARDAFLAFGFRPRRRAV